MSKEQKLWLLLEKIPDGKITTYKILADKIGTHPRAVGRILGTNPYPVAVPCHRVVCSNGNIGGYKFGVKKKIELLKKEGIEIKNRKTNVKKYLFRF